MISAPRGTRDILPGEVEKWRYVEELVHRLCAEYGYSEIRTPLFEHTELFERLGEATDTVRKEMYTFADRGGRSLTLRPEGTAPVVRAFLEDGLRDGPLPQKLYYLGPMFRYERPQSGRYRQHHQFGVEALGSLNPALDAEVILLAADFYGHLGLEVQVEINSIGCPACRPAYREALRQFFSTRVAGMCPDCRDRYERNVLRILDCKVASCQPLVAGAPRSLDLLCVECKGHFEELKGYLEETGVAYRENPRLVRGFDYYTKTVFEIAASGQGLEKALGGGGRYDGLATALEGPPTPAVGFGLGLERVLLLLDEQGRLMRLKPGLDAFVVTAGPGLGRAAFGLLNRLRRAGVAADMDWLGRSTRAQMKQADRASARWAVILGEDEARRGVLLLRDMASGEQRELPPDGALDFLRQAAADAGAGLAAAGGPSGGAASPAPGKGAKGRGTNA